LGGFIGCGQEEQVESINLTAQKSGTIRNSVSEYLLFDFAKQIFDFAKQTTYNSHS
jgi:hypothetical protein